ncbi:MAG: hypothetical protein FGF53_07250 [Candidatus Brockarchaeota archaeon]|nr:hypothetical protein [Candidatus Brockarchaeota archaeon]
MMQFIWVYRMSSGDGRIFVGRIAFRILGHVGRVKVLTDGREAEAKG